MALISICPFALMQKNEKIKALPLGDPKPNSGLSKKTRS